MSIMIKTKGGPGSPSREIEINDGDFKYFKDVAVISEPAEKMIPLWSPKTNRKMMFKESEVKQYVEEGFLEKEPEPKKEGKQ